MGSGGAAGRGETGGAIGMENPLKFTAFLHKIQVDFLNDRRIVVWYGAEAHFKVFATSFHASNCEVSSADTPVLKTHRRADAVYRILN